MTDDASAPDLLRHLLSYPLKTRVSSTLTVVGIAASGMPFHRPGGGALSRILESDATKECQ
jgi:hypothetical protein